MLVKKWSHLLDLLKSEEYNEHVILLYHEGAYRQRSHM